MLMFVRMAETHDPADPIEMWVVVPSEQAALEGDIVTDGRDAQVRSYTGLRKKLYNAVPGAIFRVRLNDTGVEFQRKAMPFMTYSHVTKVAEWRAMNNAVERAAKAAVAFEKQVTRQLDREGLDPYRAAYKRLGGPQRVQLIAEVVRYITTG
jgi:hypothetical protein